MQGTRPQALGGIRDQQVKVQAVLDAQALAAGAGAFRAIEGEQAATGLHAPGARAQPREEKAQQVPAFRERAHGGAGIGLAAVLAQGHGGAQALDAPGCWAPQAAHEVPREGGQGLQEAALALAEQGVEGQGGLARAGDARDDREAAPGELDVKALQVVGLGPADEDHVLSAFRQGCFLPVSGSGRKNIQATEPGKQ